MEAFREDVSPWVSRDGELIGEVQINIVEPPSIDELIRVRRELELKVAELNVALNNCYKRIADLEKELADARPED